LKSKCLKSFWKAYHALPESVQKVAEKNYLLWKQNPSHPSLRFKPIGDGFWSLRVGIHYRAVGYPENDTIIWVWIGHHSEYDQIK
jgi:hypothetical protein